MTQSSTNQSARVSIINGAITLNNSNMDPAWTELAKKCSTPRLVEHPTTKLALNELLFLSGKFRVFVYPLCEQIIDIRSSPNSFVLDEEKLKI